MKNFQRISFVLTAATLLTLWIHTSAIAGPLDDGREANNRGDYQTALGLWQPLADQGNADAQYFIGEMYEDGHGVKQDDTEAMKWLQKAADQGDDAAQYAVAVGYSSGNGVKQDFAEAFKWFQKVADKGDKAARFDVASAYHDGRGVKQDLVQAYMWCSLAAAAGDAMAGAMIGDYATNMTPEQIAEAKHLAAAWKPTLQNNEP
jgi:hypothetical protein